MGPGPDTPLSRPAKQTCPEGSMHPSSPSQAVPTAFFLRTEHDMQRSGQHGHNEQQSVSKPRGIEDSSYGVQSLEDALEAAFPEQTTPTQPGTEPQRQQEREADSPRSSDSSSSPILGRKRKAGNRVHPKIAAAAQRIISSEQPSSRSSSISSPSLRQPSVSPLRGHLRSESATSFGQPFTPSLRLSPRAESTIPGTPRSGSVRSFGLSDEEGSVPDDNSSQAIHSSSEDEDCIEEDTLLATEGSKPGAEVPSNVPQLVMPSIAMPTRRPFTERGKRMGKLKILVAGPARVGKTSLIRAIIQECEDVVHVDPVVDSNPSHQPYVPDYRSAREHDTASLRTTQITEVNAATKSYPSWWSEVEEGRGLRRRKSMGDCVLERNICFIDTPGWEASGPSEEDNMQDAIETIVTHMEHSLQRNANAGELADTDLLNILNGGGGFQVDAILYMFQPTCHHFSPIEADILRRLGSLTNLIPVIGRADSCSDEHIRDVKSAIRTGLAASRVKTFDFQRINQQGMQAPGPVTPFAVSSVLSDDSDIMDASVLMSSEYIQPLLPSELSDMVAHLFDPDNIQWLRHCAVKKFIQWRRENLGTSLLLHKQELNRLQTSRLASINRQGSVDSVPLSAVSSMASSPSGILIPYPSTVFHQSGARTPFSFSGGDVQCHIGALDFGRSFGQNTTYDSLQRARLAGWALDLQHALQCERNELHGGSATSDPGLIQDVSKLEQQITLTGRDIGRSTKGKGRKSVPMSAVDIKDPLGVLAFGQRLSSTGRTALRLLGGCGVATLAVWMLRNWTSVTVFLGPDEPDVHIPGYALVGQAGRSSVGGWDWKEFFWGDKW
ncbi:hypothetical protein MBLNU459_g4854t1 [Dothideomycetes sp. NU459]